MGKIEYFNPSPYKVVVVGKDGKQIKVDGHKRIVLDEGIAPSALDKLKVIRKINYAKSPTKRIAKKSPRDITKNRASRKLAPASVNRQQPQIQQPQTQATQKNVVKRAIKANNVIRRAGGMVVGRRSGGSAEASEHFRASISKETVPISNNIAIGILSYNRLNSIKRLISSIRKYTDLSRTTLFISDESTDKSVKEWLKNNNQDFVLIDNNERIGIAGNSNRLIKCMSRFKYCFLMNDDVEILKRGWEDTYINASRISGFHHFCYRQLGLLGAKTRGDRVVKNGIKLLKIDEKPHGAVMFYTSHAFNKVGYFDESWGEYGMEHVDWSNRVGLSGMQDRGFFDVDGSNSCFIIHREPSQASKKGLSEAKKKFQNVKENKERIHIEHSGKVSLPSISYVIPLRDIGRSRSISTVISNIRAQHFPVIDIVIIEEAARNAIPVPALAPINYFLLRTEHETPFNKSKAFNRGVRIAKYDKLILHDADILVRAGYTKHVYDLLKTNNGLHIGKDVLYLTSTSTNLVNDSSKIHEGLDCRHKVGYFEGGSLACTKEAYVKIGGFNMDFVGYGCEDCDFFERLRDFSGKFNNTRTETFYHLEHPRVAGWQQCHKRNQALMQNVKQKHPNVYIKELRAKLKSFGLDNLLNLYNL